MSEAFSRCLKCVCSYCCMHGRVYFPVPTLDHNSGCVHTQKNWCCWSRLLTQNPPPHVIYENRQLATASYPKREREYLMTHPSKYRALQKRGTDALHKKTEIKTLTCTTCGVRGHVLGRGKRRETRKTSTWHAVQFFLVVNTMRVKNVTTKSVI